VELLLLVDDPKYLMKNEFRVFVVESVHEGHDTRHGSHGKCTRWRRGQ
jgi:hypothetical protein